MPTLGSQANLAKHLEYPRVRDLVQKAKDKLQDQEQVIFHCLGGYMHHISVPDTFRYPKANQDELPIDWQSKYKEFISNPILNKISTLSLSGSFAKELLKIPGEEQENALAELTNASDALNLGVLATQNHTLLSSQLAGQKLIGDFTFAYIEARANYYFRNEFNLDNPVDSFWCAEGVSNLELFADVLKANQIPIDEMVVLAVPTNAIKAYRTEKFGEWTELEIIHKKSRHLGGKLYQFDKYGNQISELELYKQEPQNLSSPVYKVKCGEYWLLVVPVSESALSKFSYAADKGGFTKAVQDRLENQKTQGQFLMQVDFADVRTITQNKETVESIERAINYDFPSEGILSCSVGQAARVVFELMGGFDNIPEALFNLDGGSSSCVATEKNSDGRHLGVHDMHQIIKNKWHERDDVIIPWNIIGGDLFDPSSKHLLDDESIFILSPDSDTTRPLNEKIAFFEAPQAWKAISNELLKHFLKSVYSEYCIFATRKYHINIRDCAELLAKYLACAALYNPASHPEQFKEACSKLAIEDELLKFMEIISYIHFAACSSTDFHSTKTHPNSIIRLQWLVKAHYAFKELCPDLGAKFEARVREILMEDKTSEFTTLENLYFSELNKISS